nr:MAG TPA: Photosystem II protein D1 [Caudoviricetes sp.]
MQKSHDWFAVVFRKSPVIPCFSCYSLCLSNSYRKSS